LPCAWPRRKQGGKSQEDGRGGQERKLREQRRAGVVLIENIGPAWGSRAERPFNSLSTFIRLYTFVMGKPSRMTFRGQRLLFVYFRIQPKMTIKQTPEGVVNY
jgi:hypothetical protein